jgi:RNA polymerase sigma-70 factor (family 1)
VGLTINDNNLLLSLHKGDHEAFNVIFHYFTQPLHFFLKGIVHDDMAAEDIAIEAFTKTFRRNTDFTSIAKLKSFLFTTASNAALDFLRSHKRREGLYYSFEQTQADETETVEQLYIQTEAIQIIHTAINKLSGKPKEVIKMELIEGKSLSEIASELNISYNTVQNHKSKAMQLLRAELLNNPHLSIYIILTALTLLNK